MTRYFRFVALLSVLMIGAAPAQSVPKPIQEMVRKQLGDNLLDPESARYTWEVFLRRNKDWIVCGTVNSKNSFGGYAGKHLFFATFDGQEQKLTADVPDEPDMADLFVKVCENAARGIWGVAGQ